MQKKSYKIQTFGCKVNQHDSLSLEKKLEKNGFLKAEKNVDLVILNTCAVTKTAISKAKTALNRLRRENPQAKIVLMGCWPKTHAEEVARFEVDLIWGVGNVDEFMKKILNFEFRPESLGIESISNDRILKQSKTRYFLKVQDGCEQFCTYCIIPYARGPIKSRKVENVLKEVYEVIENGVKEIVLSGIHLGLYGTDFKEVANLVTLIKEILKVKDVPRLRLSSIEVGEVSDELLDIMKNEDKVCRHLHIPLQAGSERILKSMNRPYSKKEIFDRLIEIRKLIPEIALTTDVIVGFPGETEKEFEETCAFVKDIRFSKVHVFPYSKHEKTLAAKFPDHVSSNEKKRRAQILREISKRLEKEYKDSFKGKEQNLILEQVKNGKAIYKSEFYFDVEKA